MPWLLFAVSTRTNEIAIRMALGSARTGIVRLILISAVKLGLLGSILGVFGSLAVSRLVRSLLFEVSATDPFIYLSSVFLMMLVAMLASTIPAVRASLADPAAALRSN
jgi:ABC-type antimicrobial peptide transport system permease subunit